jgi:aminopeptidase-like protein
MHLFVSRLYPICRSITGNGVRRTLNEISDVIPLTIHEVPTGSQVFDWTIPKEWNIRDGYIENAQGQRIVDFQRHNLHVLNYSIPIKATMRLAELRPHLYTIPAHPDWVPYRTSYYQEKWGFCLSHRQLESLTDDEYSVCIDSTLAPGSLTYGEYLLPGQTSSEVLLSCHICHPSLANDNLSGMALVAYLAKILKGNQRRYSYRFLFIPGAIGSIAWLSRNEAAAGRIRHGLVAACAGDPGKMHYKKSRQGDAEIDRAVIHALKHSGEAFSILDFTPYGYDERQYCSPGFNLPVGSLTRSPNGQYPEYHSSADNPDFVRPQCLANSLLRYLDVIGILEKNATYLNTNPKCEPQLGRRGLYDAIGGRPEPGKSEYAMLWVLNLSDGKNSLLDIAERSGLDFRLIYDVTIPLVQHGLLERMPEPVAPGEVR